MSLFQISDFPRLLPELMLLLIALMVVGGDLAGRLSNDEPALSERGRAAGELTALGLGLVLFVTFVQSRFLFTAPELGTNQLLNVLIGFARNLQAAASPDMPPLLGAYSTDRLTMIARLLFAGVALVVTLLTMGEKRVMRHPAEFYGLLLAATLGLTVLAGSVELILAYVALELSSLALYVLAGYLRDDARSPEAGLKYFLFGALSSAILVYGLSLSYGLAASEANRSGANVIATLFAQVGQASVSTTAPSSLALLALVFIIAGLSYKIAAAPFHSWAPDVYQGAPPTVTVLIATASKTAGFLLLYRLMTLAFPGIVGSAAPGQLGGWSAILAVVALATLLIGNLAALRQASARRMLAYSAIGHTGFLLLALLLAGAARAGDRTFAIAALTTYLVAYVATSLTAFGVLAVLIEALGGDTLEDLRGLWRRNTTLAVLLSIALLSLAGIPPLAGFWGKLLVFMAAYRAGAGWLVAVALAATVVALAYYLRLVRALWSEPERDPAPIVVERGQLWTLGVVTALVVLIGLLPGPLWGIFEQITQVAGR